MSTRYEQRSLYGGAIVADLPADFIDASDLRQIPDHQEVFLSPTTLTSIIFEINAYQDPEDIDIPEDVKQYALGSIGNGDFGSDVRANGLEEMTWASIHHLLDPIPSEDHIDPSTLNLPPEQVVLRSASLSGYPACRQSGSIYVAPPPPPRLPSRHRPQSQLQSHSDAMTTDPTNDTDSTNTKTTTTRTFQLLVRLKNHETDLCIRINVPSPSNDASSSSRDASTTKATTISTSTNGNAPRPHVNDKELDLADHIMSQIVNTLDVHDFSLFGSE